MAKPADGSDTLAMAQIHWHRTLTAAILCANRTRLYVFRYVRLIRFSFLILITRFATLDAWFLSASHSGTIE
jgi:hypothetical protein